METLTEGGNLLRPSNEVWDGIVRPAAKHKDVHLARISAGCLVLKVFEPLVGSLHTFYHHVKA